MSIALTMRNALTGLQVNQSALAVTSSNLANLNTEGYSRKVVDQQSVIVGGQGQGVEIAAIERQVNEFLVRDLRRESSALGYAQVSAEYFDRTQELFGSLRDDSSIGAEITRLSTAMEALGTTPELSSNRFAAVNAAQAVARRLNDMAGQVQALRGQADSEIASSVQQINATLGVIAEVNARIASNRSLGLSTADLEDERDQAINAVAREMGIQYFERSDGQVTVLTKSGRTLVNGNQAATLDYAAATAMAASQSYPATIPGILVNGDPNTDITTELDSGRLKGLVDMRDATLPALTMQLDNLSVALRDELNRVHNRGSNTPMGLGLGAGPTVTGSRQFADPAAQQITIGAGESVEVVVLDANGDSVATTTLAAGTYSINAVATTIDGGLGAFGNAAVTPDGQLGLEIDSGYRVAFVDSGAAANQGDVAVAFNDAGDTSLSVSGTYLGFSSFFGLNDLMETPEPALSGFAAGANLAGQGDPQALGVSDTIRVRQQLVDDPAYLSRGVARPTGGTPAYRLGEGDNEIAQQLAGLFDRNLTFPTVPNGTPAAATTLAGYGETMLSFNANAAAAADEQLTFQSFLHENLKGKALEVSGVNQDEELANMVQYQNAYAASARLVQAASEMLDILIALGR